MKHTTAPWHVVMKTSELTGATLDWAVAKAAGVAVLRCGAGPGQYLAYVPKRAAYKVWRPSTNWVQGGPIIEREKITLEWTGEDWMGYIRHDEEFFGPTPLIAAMRCFVASKLGDKVEVPEELK